jgi:hypothetical protein
MGSYKNDFVERLAELKDKYLRQQKTDGGTAGGYRKFAAENIDRLFLEKFIWDALNEAATREWRKQPRKDGPDLFSIAGVKIPDSLTRPAKGKFITGEGLDDDEGDFEKVHSDFATVGDLIDDATIKLRKAAQASAAAEREARIADEALRRAHGDRDTLLKNIAD